MWSPYIVKEYIKINEMFSLFEKHFDEDYVFYGESHNFWECVYVLDGEICISGDERVYNMQNGDIIFHKPLELHKFYTTSKNGARLFIFSFSLEGNTEFFEEKVFSLNDEQKNIMNTFLTFLRNKNSNILNTPTMYLEKFSTSATYSQEVVSYIYQLMLSLCHESTVSFAQKKGDAKVFSDAVSYMNANIAEFPSIEEIARKCRISQSGLKNIFTKYAGLGVHKYLISLKINAARKMIEDNISITQISEKLGFSSQAYFSLAFKRETGFTPTEYKNLIR